jgi:hypothetical protein
MISSHVSFRILGNGLMKKTLLLLLCFAASLSAQRRDTLKQDHDTALYYYYTPPKDTFIYKPQGKYFRFLSSQDSSAQARLFMATLAYKCTVESPAFKLNGVYINLGLNLGRLFPKK